MKVVDAGFVLSHSITRYGACDCRFQFFLNTFLERLATSFPNFTGDGVSRSSRQWKNVSVKLAFASGTEVFHEAQ
jgi:hypothetical protein